MAACPENISYILSVDFFELISVKDQIKSHRIDHQCFCLLNQNRRKFVKRNLRKTKLFASCRYGILIFFGSSSLRSIATRN